MPIGPPEKSPGPKVLAAAALVLAALSLAVALACAASAPRTPNPSPGPARPEPWKLSFQQEGGIAGMRVSADIGSTGRALFRDQRTGRESFLGLPEAEVRDLADTLEASDFFGQPADQRTPQCRDCFTYTITLERGGQAWTVTADDAGLSDRLRPLVERLRDLTQRALQRSQP